jgi:hypothetical protein
MMRRDDQHDVTANILRDRTAIPAHSESDADPAEEIYESRYKPEMGSVIINRLPMSGEDA